MRDSATAGLAADHGPRALPQPAHRIERQAASPVVVPFAPPEQRQSPPATAPPLIDLSRSPPDISLLHAHTATACLRDGVLPWRQFNGQTIVLTDAPQLSDAALAALGTTFGSLRLGHCAPGAAHAGLMHAAAADLAREAETRCPDDRSCRSWNHRRARARGLCVLAGLALAAVLAPGPLVAALVLWASLTLVFNTALKVAAVVVDIRADRARRRLTRTLDQPGVTALRAPPPRPGDLPVISILAPLYHEREIASHLLARLAALDYPHDRLDVLLILEDDDALTHETLAALALPAWARIVEVPEGTLRTKPRALNYALTLARGEIVGIYDAEDAPDPDQLHKVAARFATAGADVACLQGVLDYYNTSSNWLARCFTLEYAMWFRLILPGLARLGLVVPLGGTTLFLRRAAIEAVGGWDAHNVTEDADLGLRLARAGYRTEIIDTVTQEEANARLWPWVRQRTRWLKGYAMTWAVHMAHPRALWRDIGAWRFFGVQVLFLGTLSQFVLAPLLWSFWLIPLGLPHPLRGVLDEGVLFGLGALFLATELVNIGVATLAARRAGRPWLALWSPTLQVYFPLATIAAWRALREMCAKPFYWDKTLHGIFLPAAPAAPERPTPATLPAPARAHR